MTEVIEKKILNRDELSRMLAYWNFYNKKVAFTNGCFDLLHLGHVDYLAKAADQGDVLIVGLNDDESTRKLKGNHRPYNSVKARAMLLASLHVVDAVVVFSEDTPYDLIKTIQPDVLVKGNDYKVEEIAGHDIVQEKGGKVVRIQLVEGYSTSLLEKKIQEASI